MPLPPVRPPLPPPDEDTVVRRPTFEITTKRKAAWLLVYLRGTYTDEIVDIIRKDIFSQKTSFAIDCSLLSGIKVTLARELWFTSNSLKSGETRLVLLNAPDQIRSLFSLISPGAKLPSFALPDDLPADAKTLEQHLQRTDAELNDIRKQLQSNALWQFVDREACWLCPFCGKIQEDIKLVSKISVAPAVVEKASRHLRHRCMSYSPANPRYLPAPQLEETIKKANESKFAASKSHAESLETKVRELSDKAQWAESMEAGLKLAVDRQKRLLPSKTPEIPGFELAIVYRPAARVSGDFYDFIEMSNGRTGFTIGDVAGHGIEAGILMGMTKKVLNIRASELDDPVQAMRRTNADIYKELDRQTFVTAFLGVLDPVKKTWFYARAGHNPPLLFNKDRTPSHKKMDAGGLMLGMSTGVVFEKTMVGETIYLQKGDTLLLYTDGLEEAKNSKAELFGTTRMANVLEKEWSRPASFILGALSFELDRFIGSVPAEDDITAVCIKVL
jgi:serine phosphatase RsbU (regulator of sigma subunit)